MFNADAYQNAGNRPQPITSNAVATPAQLVAIDGLLLAARPQIDESERVDTWLRLALYCKDNGSSVSVSISGPCPTTGWPQRAAGGANDPPARDAADPLPWTTILGYVRRHCTLRQFCMAYARIVWWYILEHQEPPAMWARQGFTEAGKYAAFDFFDGVTSPHSLPAPDNVRPPTAFEIQAANVNKTINIHRSRQQNSSTSNFAELNGSRVINQPRLHLPPPS